MLVMDALARQGVAIALPDVEDRPSRGEVIALRSPARDTAWPVSAEAVVQTALRRDEPVTVVLLRVGGSRNVRLLRRRTSRPTAFASLVRQWRSGLSEDESLVGLQDGLMGLLLPGSGLDDAFSRIDVLREQAGRALHVTATVAAVRGTESLADASRRAERKLGRLTRPGCSALAV